MGTAMAEEKKAVTSGYWNLLRYDPRLKDEGKNPFMLDSKAATTEYIDFLHNEVRYTALERMNPEKAKALFAKQEREAKERYEILKSMAEQ